MRQKDYESVFYFFGGVLFFVDWLFFERHLGACLLHGTIVRASLNTLIFTSKFKMLLIKADVP